MSADRPHVKLMVLDSSSRAQRNLVMSLEREGFELVEPTSFPEAQLCIAEEPFDVAVLSADLPDRQVLALAKAMRMQARTLSTGLVVLGNDEHPLRPQLAPFGAYFVALPLDIERIRRAIEDLSRPMPEKGQRLLLRDPTGGTVVRGVVAGIHANHLRMVPDREVDVAELDKFRSAAIEAEFIAVDQSQVAYEAVMAPSGAQVFQLGSLLRRAQPRRHFRRELAIRVRYRVPGDFARIGVTRDVSLGGMLLAGVRGQVQVGDAIEVNMVLNAQRILGPVRGVVRRIIDQEDRAMWGLGFEDLEEHEIDLLLEIIFGDAAGWDLVSPLADGALSGQ